VAGLDETAHHLIQIYWIMGRSENSRNRIFRSDNTGRLYTEAADPAKMRDPALIIYNAMREKGRHYVVSNGDQTDRVIGSEDPLYLNVALQGCRYEPDDPNFTQRITALSSFVEGASAYLQLSILRKSAFGNTCDSSWYGYIPYPGFGHCITTYAEDGSPLPPFHGDPLLMPIRGGIKDVAEAYWGALNEDNRVSLAVKFIDQRIGCSDIYIINK
jgi:hypothetical protein